MGYFLLDETKQNLLSQESHHIKKVLRMKVGDHIQATDGNGGLYEAQITSLEPFDINIYNNTVVTPSSYRLRLIISAIKTPLLELIIQKLTEIGVDEIIITHTDFSQIPLKQIESKLDRFKTIISTACKQAERTYFPILSIQELEQISYPMDNALNLIGNTQYTLGDTSRITDIDIETFSSITLFIGPEGGFSEKEYQDLVEKYYYIPVQFTPYILRTETAAMIGAGIIKAKRI